MFTKPDTLKSSDWSISLDEFGTVVQGLDDIIQCVLIILQAKKGSSPLRPEFGTNIFDLVDRPVNIAGPQVVQEIIDGITTWEPRVILKSVSWTVEDAHAIFNIQLVVNVATGEVINLPKIRFSNSPDDGGPSGIGYWVIGSTFIVS